MCNFDSTNLFSYKSLSVFAFFPFLPPHVLFYFILEKKEDVMFDVHFCNRRKETTIEVWSWKPGMILLLSTLNYLGGQMQRSVFRNPRPSAVTLLLDCTFLVDIFHSLSPHAFVLTILTCSCI